MIFTRKEITIWLGLSIFEIWLHIISILTFTILLAVKLDNPTSMSWWTAFIPLFVCDGCIAYFTSIVCIRLYLNGDRRLSAMRTIWSFCVLVLVFTYKYLLCQRLQEESDLDYAIIHIPIFILQKMLAIRACQAE